MQTHVSEKYIDRDDFITISLVQRIALNKTDTKLFFFFSH